MVLFSYWCGKSQQVSTSTESVGQDERTSAGEDTLVAGVQDWVLFEGVPRYLRDLKL